MVMLLGGDRVVEAAHRVNAAAADVDWQAAGKVSGPLEEWRLRNHEVFRAINEFHNAAREDLGVAGNVTGSAHPSAICVFLRARSPQAHEEAE